MQYFQLKRIIPRRIKKLKGSVSSWNLRGSSSPEEIPRIIIISFGEEHVPEIAQNPVRKDLFHSHLRWTRARTAPDVTFRASCVSLQILRTPNTRQVGRYCQVSLSRACFYDGGQASVTNVSRDRGPLLFSYFSRSTGNIDCLVLSPSRRNDRRSDCDKVVSKRFGAACRSFDFLEK